MPHAYLPDVELFHDTAGDDGTPVLLIMGLSGRGCGWTTRGVNRNATKPPTASRNWRLN
jgi:hypothetical protein